jgi:hypothetical protein
MNIVISCVVNGNTEYIEMYGNEALTLDVSFAEIQDITKKNSAYSRDFKVPGSKMNNYIFNYFFDINQVPLDFTPNKKFEASILYNGYVISSGYIRLNSVMIDKLEKTYNITYYNGIGDIAANIGDKFLRQLDLSSLNHPYSSDVWLQSNIDPNLFPLSGTTNYSYQNGKTYWPIYNIGYNYTDKLTGIENYYTGTSSTSIAITSGIKTITTNQALGFIIGDTVRYTNSSNQFIQGRVNGITGTTIVFTPNLALGSGTISSGNISRQLVDGEKITDPYSTPLVDFQRADVPNYISFSGTPVKQYYFKPSIQVKELYTQIFSQAGYEIESEFFDTNYFERYYLPLKFLDETIFTAGAVPICYTFSGTAFQFNSFRTYYPLQVNNTSCNNVPFSNTVDSFTIPALYSGNYTFRSTIKFNYTGGTSASFIVMGYAFNTLTNKVPVRTTVYASGTGTDTLTFDYSPTITGNTTVRTFYTVENIDLISYTFEIIKGPRIILGTFDYSNEFPENDYKQIDFITSINKMFNMVCIPHPVKPKTIIVEPIINYIGKGRILDWSDKIDYNSPITISPTTTILNGTINYNFKLDKDYGNQQFNIASNRIFGTYQLQLNQDYKDNSINFDTMFGSPTDIALTNSSGDKLTIENMAAIKNENVEGQSLQQYNPYRILPRIVFRGATIPNDNWGIPQSGTTNQLWYAETYPQDRWQETSRFTTYPFSYSGFSHYLNWNAQDVANTNETIFPEQDLYDIYYYDYISDITAPENKIYQAKIYLTPNEIANLEFNEKILIKNTYFRINKISGYNLTEPTLCNIELIKLTKDYTPVPVQYYDLINCTPGGTDYHTTSNLNYNMYAYVGNYVNIFTGSTTAYTSIGCFEVQLGQPNDTYDYDHVFIGSGYTSSGVAVYSDCGCNTRTPFNIVQQT